MFPAPGHRPCPFPDSPLPPLRLPRSELAASRLPPASGVLASQSIRRCRVSLVFVPPLPHTLFYARARHSTQPPSSVRRSAVCKRGRVRRAPRPAPHQQPSCSHQLNSQPSHRPTIKHSTQVRLSQISTVPNFPNFRFKPYIG